MTLFAFHIQAEDTVHIQTELLYAIAHAAAINADLLRLSADADRLPTVERLLGRMKKEGRIRVFVSSSALQGARAEARYLLNKYPDIKEQCQDPCLFVRA